MNFLNLFLADAANTASKAAGAGAGGTAFMIIYIVVIIAVFYFVLIRPQRKKQKKEEAMRNNVQVGDEIITIGGIYGRVMSIKDDSLVIESLGDHSKQRIAKWALQQNLTIHDDVAK